MRFRDIKQFTDCGNYYIHTAWEYLERTIDNYNKYGLIMEPDYQRGHVWTNKQQVAFIEFGLRGGKAGMDVWFNCPGWQGTFRGPIELVDGLQRITAVLKFKQNEFPIFGDCYYKDFTDKMDITRTRFVWHVNDLDSREKVLQWYLEMNSGGVVHSKKELDRVKKLLEEEKQLKKE